MSFKPLAFGLLAGDKPETALKNAVGILPGAKAYFDKQEADDKAASAKAAAATAATGNAPGNVINKKKGGKISSASSRADGCATKGKTRGQML